MTLTFDLNKLTTVKKFTLSTLPHNKTSNKKFSTIDALQMQIEKITESATLLQLNYKFSNSNNLDNKCRNTMQVYTKYYVM